MSPNSVKIRTPISEWLLNQSAAWPSQCIFHFILEDRLEIQDNESTEHRIRHKHKQLNVRFTIHSRFKIMRAQNTAKYRRKVRKTRYRIGVAIPRCRRCSNDGDYRSKQHDEKSSLQERWDPRWRNSTARLRPPASRRAATRGEASNNMAAQPNKCLIITCPQIAM
jgi:hypothetical protein